MSGMADCSNRSLRSPDPKRLHVKRLVALAAALAALMAQPGRTDPERTGQDTLPQTPTDHTRHKRPEAIPPHRAPFVRRFANVFGDLPPKDILTFYARHIPEALAEFDDRCRENPGTARRYLSHLVKRYAALLPLRSRNAEEYKRILAVERMEAKTRRLGRTVRQQNKAGTDAADTGGSGPERGEADEERELRGLLSRVFAAVQQNQLIEINRLEAELRELRRLVAEREANKDLILQTRFEELAGTRNKR